MGNEWEKVPGDLLRKIEERLMWYVDKVRFYFVCKSWQSQLPYHSQFPLPLLLLPSDYKLDGATHQFLSIVDNKTYYLDLHKLDEFGSVRFIGSSHGWVVAMARSKKAVQLVLMFNPLTGLHKLLPSRFNIPEHIKKCVVSSNPSLSDDFMVIAIICGSFPGLAYTMWGDDKWNAIESNKKFIDIIFYEGRLYGLTVSGQLMLIEISSSNAQLVQISTNELSGVHKFYLVNSSAGLLAVEWISKRALEKAQGHKVNLKSKTRQFNVYKFDFGVGQWSSSLTDIGDDILFVGSELFVYGSAMSISSKDCPAGFKGNTIYFFDDCKTWSRDDSRRECIQMGLFDLKTKKIEELHACKYSPKWIPSMPIWFTPTTYY